MANLRVDQFALAPTLTLSDIIPVIPQPGIVAKQTTFGDLKTLLGTPLANSIAVVDPINGSASGVIGDLTKPFQTITQAQSAVVAGQTIVVYPGTYLESNLGKANINFYFTDGAIVDSGAFSMFVNPAGCSYSITGNGEFTASTGGDIFQFTGGGTITIEAKKIYTTSGLVVGTNSCTAYVNVQESILSTTGRCFVQLANSIQYITCPFVSSGGAAIAEVTVDTATLYLKSDNIVATGTAAFSLIGTAYISGIVTYSGILYAIVNGVGGNCNFTFYNDIIVTNPLGTAVFFITATTGFTHFYGKIISAGFGVGIGNTTTAVHTFYDDIQSDSNTPVVSITSGTVKLKGKIKNMNIGAGAYGIGIVPVGTLIVDNTTIVTAGVVDSIYSAVPTNIKIYGTLVQNAVFNGNITDITGGVVQTSINVE